MLLRMGVIRRVREVTVAHIEILLSAKKCHIRNKYNEIMHIFIVFTKSEWESTSNEQNL